MSSKNESILLFKQDKTLYQVIYDLLLSEKAITWEEWLLLQKLESDGERR